jgi:hypothetical protein
VLDAVLTSAFDATPEKLEIARKPLKASLHAMALKAARQALSWFLCSRSWFFTALARPCHSMMSPETCKK